MYLRFFKRAFLSFVVIICFSVGIAHSATDTRGVHIIAKDEKGGSKTLALYDRITAVIIGIDRYQNLKAENQLKFAIRDAKGVEQVLRDRYPVSKIITLYDEQATRDNIMKVLQGDLATAGSDEAILIYYAGHGITRSPQQKKLGFLIPHDGSLEINEMHKNISMQQIGSDISPLIPAKHVLFIMDSCFGGLLLSTRGAGMEPSHKLSYLEEITREQVRQIITAGGENEEVLDGGLYGYSVFTGRLIEALKNNRDYITAQELGLELEKKVYGDAMSKGHKQRPQIGKIYGTGDFVFIPDFEKLKKESEGEVSTLESEMRELERLKQEAGKRKEDAKIRELERERLLKEAALKQARLREESARREDELRKKMEEESLKGAEESKKQERERSERLAYLKIQSEKMKQELGSPASALGLSDAQAEVGRLNQLIAKLEGDYQTELPKQLSPVKEYYRTKIEKAEKILPFDKMFETEAEYKERLEKAKEEASSLKAELSQKEAAITGQLKTEMTGQIKPLIEQKNNLTKQEFPIGNNEIKWKFEKYYPVKEEFSISGAIKDTEVWINIPISKAKAREYYQNPDLLVASAVIGISSNGSTEPLKFTLHGPEGNRFEGNLKKYSDYMKNLPPYTDNENGTITHNVTKLMWQKEDDNTKREWNDAINYCKGLSIGGYSDWRLPNIEELKSIIYKGNTPTINTTYFSNTKYTKASEESYWLSTPLGAFFFISGVWYVNFGNGGVGSGMSSSNYVRRSGWTVSSPHLLPLPSGERDG